MAILAAIGGTLCAQTTYAYETGPLTTPLNVTYYWDKDGGAVFVMFNENTMPDCYHNRGGNLRRDHINFDQHYALLLTLLASGGKKGQVLYEITGAVGAWSRCTITGFSLQP